MSTTLRILMAVCILTIMLVACGDDDAPAPVALTSSASAASIAASSVASSSAQTGTSSTATSTSSQSAGGSASSVSTSASSTSVSTSASSTSVSTSSSTSVSTSSDGTASSSGSGYTSFTEDFTGFSNGGTATSYLSGTWPGNNSGASWAFTAARADQNGMDGTKGVCLRHDAPTGTLTVTIPGGVYDFSFDVKQVFTGTGPSLAVYVDGTPVAGSPFAYSAAGSAYGPLVVDKTSSVVIKFSNASTSTRPTVDNFVWRR